jgi:PilZ domain-containing protein
MLRSLLLSRNDNTVRMIDRGFKDLEVELEPCSESDLFLLRALETRYDAIVLDDHVEDAPEVLAQLLGFATCSKSVRIVLAEPKAAMHSVFKTGTQIVLYKPLSTERLRQGLRAVRNLMARGRRRGGNRVSAMVPARISPRHAKSAAVQVLLADISDFGAAIRYEKGDLPVTNSLNLEFALPGNPDRFHCLVELVWQDHQGAGGLRFLDMPSYARQELAEWIKENQKPSRRAARAGGDR